MKSPTSWNRRELQVRCHRRCLSLSHLSAPDPLSANLRDLRDVQPKRRRCRRKANRATGSRFLWRKPLSLLGGLVGTNPGPRQLQRAFSHLPAHRIDEHAVSVSRTSDRMASVRRQCTSRTTCRARLQFRPRRPATTWATCRPQCLIDYSST